MKTKLLFLMMLVSTIAFNNASATMHMITAGPNNTTTFSPSTLTIPLGDTIMWMWATDDHTTTSTTIPSGAAAWDAPLNITHTSFTYVPTVVGTYNYKCIPHESMGMLGSFTVVFPTSVPNTVAQTGVEIYPNPASNEMRITGNATGVDLMDVTGKVIRHMQPESVTAAGQYYRLNDITAGMYLLKIKTNEAVLIKKLQIAK